MKYIIYLLISFTFLLSAPADKINAQNEKQIKKEDHFLISLIKNNKKEELEELIKKGVNINTPIPNTNMKPLLSAVIYNNTDIVRVLLDNGANVNDVHSSGMTPLLYAIKLKNDKIVNLLISKKVNINYKEKESGVTPLMYAVRLGDPVIVYTLIKNNANLFAKDKYGYTVYDYAKHYQGGKILNMIEEAQKKVNGYEK